MLTALALILAQWSALPPAAERHPPACIVHVRYMAGPEVDHFCRRLLSTLDPNQPLPPRIDACTVGCERWERDPCEMLWSGEHAVLSCHENGRTNGYPRTRF